MKSIYDIDKNFQIETTIDLKGRKVLDVSKEPFEIFGLIKPDENEDYYRRIPAKTAKQISERVEMLCKNTAGGRVRFSTDSQTFGLIAEMNGVCRMPHMSLSGSCGFDCFSIDGEKYTFRNMYISFMENTETLESVHWIAYEGMKDVEFNFPLYSGVKKLYVVLDENAKVEKTKSRYKNIKPIIYYGSSITQGGCASRPGLSYQSIIERMTNVDYVNLGFSGSAVAEDKMAEYIAGMDMSLFVYDYDHNAGSPEYLEKTHEKMFKTIRKVHPDIPIICASMPYEECMQRSDERRAAIKKTVANAILNGDNNVYFIDGRDFSKVFGNKNDLTVDNCHPNDYGFMCMAKVFGDKIKELLDI